MSDKISLVVDRNEVSNLYNYLERHANGRRASNKWRETLYNAWNNDYNVESFAMVLDETDFIFIDEAFRNVSPSFTFGDKISKVLEMIDLLRLRKSRKSVTIPYSIKV